VLQTVTPRHVTPPWFAKSAVKDATPRLAYYASQLPGKETWFQTDEGYRIYKNVPINRTGSQEYLGREIKKNPGYRDEWDIGDDEVVTVHRPHSEVTSAETLASFEGKSTLDEHPPDPQVLIDALDEYEGVSCGHATNIRVGDTLDDGETSVIADLWVKHPELNIKIDGGVRDVSCGYTFLLDKDESGRYVMRKIRGNHVAVVPKGRAGSEVGIKDAALRRITMSNRLFRALGFQAWIKDAKPEEIADALEGMEDADEVAKKAAEKEEAARDKSAKDKAAKDKAAKDKAAKDAGENVHPEGCMCDAKDCMIARGAKDADEFGEDEMTDADKLEEEEKKKNDEEEKAAKDLDALVLPSGEHSESEFSVGDTAKLLLKMKPVMAKSKDKGAKDAYNTLCKNVSQVKAGVKDGAPDPFKMLVNIASGAKDGTIEEIPINQFFSGRSHADGLKAYNDYTKELAASRR